MEFKDDIPTQEDLDFIVDDGYRHNEDPTYEPKDYYSSSDYDKYVVSGKAFKKLTSKAKKLGADSLDYSSRKNTWQHFQVERKFILGLHIIQTILFIRIRKEEIDILLELKRLKINREN